MVSTALALLSVTVMSTMSTPQYNLLTPKILPCCCFHGSTILTYPSWMIFHHITPFHLMLSPRKHKDFKVSFVSVLDNDTCTTLARHVLDALGQTVSDI